MATVANFSDTEGNLIDSGVVIYYPAPNSFTGEDIVELQGHGSPVAQDLLVGLGLMLGARSARPGEFSQRAFLNDKLDLVQAEAIADLISSSTRQAARAAMRSLSGQFSETIDELLEELIRLRVFVEAAIDFPDEEIDFLSDGNVGKTLEKLQDRTKSILRIAGQGSLLLDGIYLVIAGKPNAGKSSLLNMLSGKEVAIVTAVPGTTRDAVRETIDLDGLPVHIVDTAGLRDSPDEVERLGIERTRKELSSCDHVLLVVDASSPQREMNEILVTAGLRDRGEVPFTLIYNKTDLIKKRPVVEEIDGIQAIYLSALTGDGIELLRTHLKDIAGYASTGDGLFTARRRHIDALERMQEVLSRGQALLADGAGELLAEDLLLAQNILAEITGSYTSDDLLGEIFGSFCIGK